MDLKADVSGSESRFGAFVESLALALGHADCIAPMKAYCTGLTCRETARAPSLWLRGSIRVAFVQPINRCIISLPRRIGLIPLFLTWFAVWHFRS